MTLDLETFIEGDTMQSPAMLAVESDMPETRDYFKAAAEGILSTAGHQSCERYKGNGCGTLDMARASNEVECRFG